MKISLLENSNDYSMRYLYSIFPTLIEILVLAITEASLTRVFGTKSHSMPALVHRRSVVHKREVLVVMAAVTSLAWRWVWQHAMWRST